MAKMTEYTAATRFDTGDILIKDGNNGTKKITVANAASEFAGLVSSTQRRNVFRGKNLGTSITAAQKTAISSGTFDDLFIGDYWTLNGTRYDIADMDYWYNCGDETVFNRHHLVMIPHTALYNAKMNETSTTEGGYVGSDMYTTNLDQAKTKIGTDFGTMLLTHREYLVNAVTDGHPSAGAWFDSTVDLMNEIMVYGSYIHTPGNNGVTIPTRYTINKQQLALFALSPKSINTRSTIWLRDVVSASNFALVSSYGNANSYGASASYGVRPVFAIG
jgi:hypothetical protein